MMWRVVVVVSILVPTLAFGQDSTGIDGQLFRPSATSAGLLGIDEGDTPGHLGTTFGLFTHWTRSPVVLQTSGGDTKSGAVISNLVGFDAQGSLGLLDFLELGVAIPVTAFRGGDVSLPGAPPLAAAGLGDLRLAARGIFLRQDLGPGRFLLGATAGFSLPTGNSESFGGTPGGVIEPRVMGEFMAPRYAFVLDLGARLRKSVTVLGNEIGDAVTVGVGGRFAAGLPNLDLDAALQGELHGGAHPAALELFLGARYRVGSVTLSLGFGRGITNGIGTSELRLLGGIQLLPDSDDYWRKYVAAHTPPPPPPPPDSDGDGIADARDACPRVPGVAPDGCPADPDHDGLVGADDKCPTQPGPRELFGCPNVDSDGDTVADVLDQCPREFGTPFNHGCPETDRDGDGIVDRLDKCPDEPETFNGTEDEDGCPDAGEALVVLTHDQIEIRRPVQFHKIHYGSAKWTVDEESFPLLKAVATVLQLHPEILKVEIQGHTDNQGGRLYNEDLSELRAAAVRDHLITVNHVAPERLSSKGFAYDRPIAPNITERGRAMNRRVEFRIVQRADQPIEGEARVTEPSPSRER